mmetsp:Transcript_4343/g.16347  ORF Transcript_4343/g.16347 Transcript_4343/m.16347 type:complete len:248 (+) Transcript_4343:310-1053(+)
MRSTMQVRPPRCRPWSCCRGRPLSFRSCGHLALIGIARPFPYELWPRCACSLGSQRGWTIRLGRYLSRLCCSQARACSVPTPAAACRCSSPRAPARTCCRCWRGGRRWHCWWRPTRARPHWMQLATGWSIGSNVGAYAQLSFPNSWQRQRCSVWRRCRSRPANSSGARRKRWLHGRGSRIIKVVGPCCWRVAWVDPQRTRCGNSRPMLSCRTASQPRSCNRDCAVWPCCGLSLPSATTHCRPWSRRR